MIAVIYVAGILIIAGLAGLAAGPAAAAGAAVGTVIGIVIARLLFAVTDATRRRRNPADAEEEHRP